MDPDGHISPVRRFFKQSKNRKQSMDTEIALSPAQHKAYRGLLGGIQRGDICVLRGDAGSGRTTILYKLHASEGGALLSIRDFMESLKAHEPVAIEEAFLDMIETAIAANGLVVVDDLDLVTRITEGCDYPRAHLIDAALTALLGQAAARGTKLVFAVEGEAPWPVRRRAFHWAIEDFTPEDYARLCQGGLGADCAPLDWVKIHRFAPKLNGHQLRKACAWLRHEQGVDTERFIGHLKSQNTESNVDLAEVRPVDWRELKGVDDVIEALEAKIALPLENEALATELNLKPKRGVLLAGPPGTGKTTVGRALAHRLKGKFFLIDGTVVAGSGGFYATVDDVFERAKKSAPSIIFIDDADVLFEGKENRGFYRYLLTMLDGLESASAERVCVMMTAMDVGSLPEALVRSGRVELWLETRLPDTEARLTILREKLAPLPPPLGAADCSILAPASRGLTGADLKAVVEDAKLLFAHDKAKGRPLRPVEEYFIDAIETLRANRRKHARNKPVKLAEPPQVGFAAQAR
jgi:transitional endoplasmic reticulum ATPase